MCACVNAAWRGVGTWAACCWGCSGVTSVAGLALGSGFLPPDHRHSWAFLCSLGVHAGPPKAPAASHGECGHPDG